MEFRLDLPLETPKRDKYIFNRAKDYIIELMDGRKAWVKEWKASTSLDILKDSDKLEDCTTEISYYGEGLLDEKAGLYAFYVKGGSDRSGNCSGKVGRPIFIGRILKYRKHITLYMSTPRGKWNNYIPPTNKLYFVTNKWEASGFYVIAKSPEKARYQVYTDLDCDYLDSRARRVHIKDEGKLSEYRENVVIYPDCTHILDHLEVEYSAEEEI